tara:strand:- start:127 stop:339 length:213 start_codon:yes stop_codon:yes gene_type:complete
MEENNKTISEIKIEIKLLEKKVNDIQEQCNHSTTLIKFVENSKGVRKVCKDCEKIISYPSEKELKDNDFK